MNHLDHLLFAFGHLGVACSVKKAYLSVVKGKDFNRYAVTPAGE